MNEENLLSFTPRALQVLALAREEAARFSHHFVNTEHLLLGIIRLGQGTAVNALQRLGFDPAHVRQEVEKAFTPGTAGVVDGRLPYAPAVKKVLALAAREARAMNHTYVGTEHMLLGLLREGEGVAAKVLKNLRVDLDACRREILKVLDPSA